MHPNFAGIDRQPQATTGKHWQAELPILGAVPRPQMLDAAVIDAATFNGVLSDASRHSGKDDQEIADLKRQLAAYGEKAA